MKSYFKPQISLDKHVFFFIGEINPMRDSNGQILQFFPQSRYAKSSFYKLNAHGHGSFCKFTISPEWKERNGVYALYSNNELLYIGESIDLYKRFNTGYGNISPKNCYERGQPTNCKINKLILSHCLNGSSVALYFYETSDYKRIEKELRGAKKPPYNSA
jgi:hypothetical protein